MSRNHNRGQVSLSRVAVCAVIFVMVLGVASFVAQQSWAADTVYVRIVGGKAPMDGASKDPAHMGWIAATSVAVGDLNGDGTADRESSAPSVSEATVSKSSPKANIGSQSSGAGAGKASTARDASSGMTTGKRMHKPFVIMKEVDKTSPLLKEACASGQHFAEVDVDVAASGKTMHYKLTDVFISAVNATSMSGGGERPTESISFTYQKIEVK